MEFPRTTLRIRPAAARTPKLLVALALLGAAGASLAGPAAADIPATTLWQIGTFQGGTIGPARAEFPTTGGFVDTFTYAANGLDARPTFPGILLNGGNANGALRSRVVNVDFNAPCLSSEASFTYARAGREVNRLELDGVTFATVSATEGTVSTFNFDLGELALGAHRITITYIPGGAGHIDHGIDALKLDLVTCDAGIDVKPGSSQNPINPGSRGKTPVAILSHAGFDAMADVDVDTLTFGATGDEDSLSHCDAEGEDVDGDGLLDRICHFHTQAAGFSAGDTVAVLEGETIDGLAFSGTNTIHTVGGGN